MVTVPAIGETITYYATNSDINSIAGTVTGITVPAAYTTQENTDMTNSGMII